MNAWWIIGPLDALFAVFAVFLFTGKGSFLIAGYNTASAEEKAKYDAKKLGRVTGILLLVAAGLISLPLVFHNTTVTLIMPVLVVAAALATVFYANTYCKKKQPTSESVDFSYLKVGKKETGGISSQTAKIVFILVVAVVPVVIVLIFIYNMSRPPIYVVSNDALTIQSSYGETIRFSDIQDIQLKSTLPDGLSKENGVDAGPVLKGDFTSKEGDATVFLNTDVPPFIYIKTNSEWIICNDRSAEKTRALYDTLKSK